MRWKASLLYLGLCLPSTGCHVFWYGTYNLVEESVRALDERSTCQRNANLAHVAWRRVEEETGSDRTYSADYICGFKQGFADYLDSGGAAEAPPLPPPRYWTVHYQTPEGRQAVADWTTGFRHGALLARDSGFREERVLVPVSLRCPGQLTPPLIGPSANPLPETPLPMPHKLSERAPSKARVGEGVRTLVDAMKKLDRSAAEHDATIMATQSPVPSPQREQPTTLLTPEIHQTAASEMQTLPLETKECPSSLWGYLKSLTGDRGEELTQSPAASQPRELPVAPMTPEIRQAGATKEIHFVEVTERPSTLWGYLKSLTGDQGEVLKPHDSPYNPIPSAIGDQPEPRAR